MTLTAPAELNSFAWTVTVTLLDANVIAGEVSVAVLPLTPVPVSVTDVTPLSPPVDRLSVKPKLALAVEIVAPAGLEIVAVANVGGDALAKTT